MKYLALLIVVIAITGCGSCREPQKAKPNIHTADPTEVIGDDLMIALSKAKNFYGKARVYKSEGKLVEAIASVREILSLKFPANAPEAEDVRNDARAMLAKLLVEQAQLEEAMSVVTEGIAQSTRESFFVANLYTVKGEIHEARADKLEKDAADKQKIVDEKHQAIEAYDKSNAINTELQRRLMEER